MILSSFLLMQQLHAVPSQAILLRHGEKPPTGNELSLKGQQRAAALVPFFLGNSFVTEYGMPIAIFVEKPLPSGEQTRALMTMKALATAVNITPNISFDKEDIVPIATEILTNPTYSGKMVVVCWEHNAIPPIASALGATNCPTTWDKDDYDRLWILTFNQDGTVTFANLPQQLLFGDSTN